MGEYSAQLDDHLDFHPDHPVHLVLRDRQVPLVLLGLSNLFRFQNDQEEAEAEHHWIDVVRKVEVASVGLASGCPWRPTRSPG